MRAPEAWENLRFFARKRHMTSEFLNSRRRPAPATPLPHPGVYTWYCCFTPWLNLRWFWAVTYTNTLASHWQALFSPTINKNAWTRYFRLRKQKKDKLGISTMGYWSTYCITRSHCGFNLAGTRGSPAVKIRGPEAISWGPRVPGTPLVVCPAEYSDTYATNVRTYCTS